jgi:hypothetical protein
MRLNYNNILSGMACAGLCFGVASAHANPLIMEDFNDVTLNTGLNPCTAPMVAATPVVVSTMPCTGQLPAGTSATANVNIRRGDNTINTGTLATGFDGFFQNVISNKFLVLGDASGVIGTVSTPVSAPEQGIFSIQFPFTLPAGMPGTESVHIVFDWAFDGYDSNSTAGVADLVDVSIVGNTDVSIKSLSSDLDLGSSDTFDEMIPFSTFPTGNLSLRFRLTEHTSNLTNTAFAVDNIRVVPEPASIALFGLALAGLLATRKRRT